MKTLAFRLAILSSGCLVACGDDAIGEQCPPQMVFITARDGVGAYCIDQTEVTVAAYEQLSTSQHIPEPIMGCLMPDPFETSWFTRSASEPSAPHPAGGMSWCQAATYCKWRGKRLCAGEQGLPLDLLGVDVGPTFLLGTEWGAACSQHGTQQYSYGDDFDAEACSVFLDDGSLSTKAAGSKASCEGGYPGLYDMSGSLWEWTDACVLAGSVRSCLAMGGAANVPRSEPLREETARCTRDSRVLLDTFTPAELDWNELGARCCASAR